MGFVRKIAAKPVNLENFKGGNGTLEMRPIFKSAEEMHDKGRVFAHMALNKGCEIGRHTHHGDSEIFYILKGHGKFLFQGKLVDVGPGDVLFTDDGEDHYMVNEQDEKLEFIALVLFSR